MLLDKKCQDSERLNISHYIWVLRLKLHFKNSAMKQILQIFALVAVTLASCTSPKYATTTSTYESDDVYYQPSDTYISDFALVDDEARMQDPNSVSSDQIDQAQSDDYYSPDSNNPDGGTVNNYYGDVYQSPWSNNLGCGAGWGNYNFGSYSNFWTPRYTIGYNPWSGWYSSFNFGYNWGYSPFYSPYYAGGFGWYSPYYNPWYYNQWGYNTWYTPYNYYNPYYGYNNPYYGGYWNGNYWNDDSNYSNVVFGHRNPIATGSLDNSTYGDDIFYSGRVNKPSQTTQPALASSPLNSSPSTVSSSHNNETQHAAKPDGSVSSIIAPAVSTATVAPGTQSNSNVANTPSVHAEKPTYSNETQTSVIKPQVNSNTSRPTYAPEVNKPNVSEQSRPSTDAGQSDYYSGPARKPSNNTNTRPVSANPKPVIPMQNGVIPSSTPTRNETPAVRNEVQRPNQQARPEQRQVAPSKNPMPSNGGDKGGRTVSPPQKSPSNNTRPSSPPSGGGQHNSGGSISGPRKK
jgi:hypothetical protein